MKRLALLLTISLSAFAAGPPAPYLPSPRITWDGEGFQAGFPPPNVFGAKFIWNGTTYTPATTTGAAIAPSFQNNNNQPNAYFGSMVFNTTTNSWQPDTGGGSGGATTFDQIGSGTNTSHGLVVGSGSVLTTAGTGFINANELGGTALSTLSTGPLCNTTSTGAAYSCAASDIASLGTLSNATTGNAATATNVPASGLTGSILPSAIAPVSAPGLYTVASGQLTSTATATFPSVPIIGQRINLTGFPTVPVQTNTSSFSPAQYEYTPQSIWMPTHANDPYHGGQLSIGTPAPEPGNFKLKTLGDSIEFGFGLSAVTQAHPQVLAAWNGLQLIPNATSGQTCYGQQAAHLDKTANAQGVMMSNLGINDLARYGIAPLADYAACKRTEWVNMGLGETVASSMTQSGTAWTAATVSSQTGSAMQTTTINNPLTVTFSGDAFFASVAYGPSTNTTQYSITIDGTVYKTATAAVVANAYPVTNGDTTSLVETFAFYNIPPVAGALHSASFNETVNGSFPLTVWGASSNDHNVRSAFLNVNPARMTSPGTAGTGPGCGVAVGGVGYNCWCAAATSGGTVTQTAAQCDAAVTTYKQSNNTEAALMAKSGVDLITVDMDPYAFNPQDVTQTVGDGLHPNQAAQLAIAKFLNKYITTAFRMRDRQRLDALVAQFNPNGPTPTMVAGAAAGTSPTCTSLVGTDTSFVISCTTGTSTTTGTLATVTFNPSLGNAPQGCQLTPRNSATAPTATSVYTTTPSTTTWTIGVASALTASTAYSWSGICL